jgi:hypothetical protein
MTDQELYVLAHELLEYKEGKLLWKISRRGATKGKRVGTQMTTGYRVVTIKWICYCEHRIVFLMHHGYLPTVVDHINRDPSDNRIENLRAADWSSNQHNRAISKKNTSGFKGVTWDKSRGLYMAAIRYKGGNKNGKTLGRFKTAEEAHEAYKAAALKYHGEFACF